MDFRTGKWFPIEIALYDYFEEVLEHRKIYASKRRKTDKKNIATLQENATSVATPIILYTSSLSLHYFYILHHSLPFYSYPAQKKLCPCISVRANMTN